MNKPLIVQLPILVGVSLLLAVVNNGLIAKDPIEWVRDWPSFTSLAEKAEAVTNQTPAPQAAGAAEDAVIVDEAAIAQEISDRVTSNYGVTDIDLATAVNIHTYARDFTFWIDARSAELYNEGHIEGSALLHIYEKNEYLPQVQAQIEETQPIALVIYCRGADCTDSHHLAQDMQAIGFENIFVYTGGFDEWYQAGHPIEGTLADSAPAADATVADTMGDQADDAVLAQEISDRVTSNYGVTDIDLATAVGIHRYARDFTFWIDARSADLYDEGHIEGAALLHLYEKNEYLPQVQMQIEEAQPIALVIYCRGADCTDSHHLAQDMQAIGFENIFVYTGGFDEWYQAGHAIEGSLAAQATSEAETADVAVVEARAPLEEERPPGMYLEHILRDMIPFVLGIALLAFWRKGSNNRIIFIAASVFVGAFFLYAALPKLDMPYLFAKNIWNYDIVPGKLVNFSALMLPAVELVVAIGLITGLFRRGSGLIVSALLVIFIVAVSFNVLRGHEFDCGCTSAQPWFENLYIAGWNDKFTLILRDIGLLVMSWLAFVKPLPKREG